MNLTTIAALFACLGTVSTVIFAYLGFKRGIKQQQEADEDRRKREEEEKKDEGEESGNLKADMSYIRRRVDDILLEQRDTNKAVNALAERVTRVEESAKQAHLRITENSSSIRDLQKIAQIKIGGEAE